MAQITETPLPGVGIRYDFTTQAGARVGVVAHRSGYRQLLIYDEEDPDRCEQVVRLGDDDSRTLAEMLGASRISDQLADLKQSVEGLVIDWLPVDEASACNGRTIGDFRVRTVTGVSVVAVLRDDDAFPAPAPDFRLEAGDTAVVVGTADGVKQAFRLLQGR